MKIATYNINGINGRLAVLLRWLAETQPDIVCLQELKAPQDKCSWWACLHPEYEPKKGLLAIYTLFLAAIIVAGCGGKNTSSNVEAPGSQKPAKEKTLNLGADVIQDKTPLKGFDAYLDGFHFYNGNINVQMEAHHYVNQINEDVYQAIIFDGNSKDAKIMGIEYIITPKLFAQLTAEEKKLWHSHHYEVSSGGLIAPGIPQLVERVLMEKLICTYGKTIHTWHTDQDRTLPVGAPMIMMGMTKDGQLNPKLLSDRDKRFNISTQKLKKQKRYRYTPS